MLTFLLLKEKKTGGIPGIERGGGENFPPRDASCGRGRGEASLVTMGGEK